MYPALTPVGKRNMWCRDKNSKKDLFQEISAKEKEIEEMKSRETEVKPSLREDSSQEEEDEEEEEEAEVPSDQYQTILNESVEMEEASLSYMFGSLQDDDDSS